MAIEPVKKISIIAHKGVEDGVVETLRGLASVHLDRADDPEFLSARQLTGDKIEERRRLELALAQVDFLLTFLKEHSAAKPGFLKTMIKDKYHMTLEEFDRAGHRLDLQLLYAECSEFQRRLTEWQDRTVALGKEIEELENWSGLSIPLDEIHSDPSCTVKTVRVSHSDVPALRARLAAEAPESELECLKERGIWTSCLLLYHPSLTETIASIIRDYELEEVTLELVSDEAADRIEQARRELTALKSRRERAVTRVASLQEKVPALDVLHELLSDGLKRIEATTAFGETRSAVAIQGWLTEDDMARTLEAVEGVSDDVVVEIAEPGEEDDAPVSLKNPGWARPFELLVTMYGPPNQREYDPTIIVGISFAIFFGFCIGDAGYGALLIPAFLLMRKYLPLGPKAKDFLVVLTYGAGMAIVFGILTGSYFGIDIAKLPAPLQTLAVLDPLGKTMLVMGVCIGIGVVHMLVGTAVEFRDNWRAGNRADALIDQGLVFLLFAGGGIAAALAAMKVIPSSVVFIVGGAAIVLMLCLLGRSAKGIGGKIVNGIYETYGTVVGFISDAISYVRLFALGLATFIIAFVVNTMAGLTRGIGPVIGILIMLIVLLVGHTFNIAINLLGAFVHPLRLEFVEFFGKFYEDGGRHFRPFGVDSKIVFIKDSQDI